MNALRLLLLCLLPLSVLNAAVPVPLTGKLVPGSGPGAVLAVDGNYAAESSGESDYGANTSAGSIVLVRDRTLGSAWPVRKVITPPASLTDVQDYGKSLALDGETLAINSLAHIFIHQRNQGGADQWGLVRTITRTASGIGLDLDGDALAAQVLTSSGAVVVIYRRNLGGTNAWGVESTVTDVRAEPCTGFCPVDPDESSAWGARIALSGDIFAVNGTANVGGTLDGVFDLYRRGDAGGTAWGLYRSLDRTKVVGAPVQLGTAFDWADGQLCFSSLRLIGSSYGAWFHIATPPASAGGIWPQVHAGSMSGGSEVPYSFGMQVRTGAGWAAVTRLRQSSTTTEQDVVIYRNGGGGWASERTVSAGSAGDTIDFSSFFEAGSGFPDTPQNRFRLLHGFFRINPGLACDGTTLLSSAAKGTDSLTGPAGCALVHERGASSLWPLTATFNPAAPFAGDFGRSISIGGNMMAVGDTEDSEAQPQSGAVDLWVRDSRLTRDWRKFGRVKSDTAVTGSLFGRSVATDGDLLIVGAPGENGGRGAVYIFSRGPAVPDTGIYTWRQRAVIRRPSDAANTQFGFSVALNGGEVAIGAPGYPLSTTPGADVTGRVLLYRRVSAEDDTVWTFGGALAGSDSADNSQFGYSVAWEGDTIASGAWLQPGGGAVYVFRGTGTPTVWTQVKKCVPSDTSRGLMGGSISLSGNTLAVGTFPPIIFPNSGGVFLFDRNQGGTNQWGETSKLVPPVNQSSWGASVAVSGDTLVIGSSVQTFSGINRSGAAFVHRRDEGGTNAWGQVRQLIPPDSAAEDLFGSAVAIDDSAIAVSATGADEAAADAGAVYTWRLGSFEIWAGTHAFAAGQDTVTADPDGDGLVNLVEFVLGSNPLNRASRGAITHRMTTVGTDRYLEGVWAKPAYSTAGVDVVLRGGLHTSSLGDYLSVVLDTSIQKVFRAPQPVRVRPRYFMRMELIYPDTIQ